MLRTRLAKRLTPNGRFLQETLAQPGWLKIADKVLHHPASGLVIEVKHAGFAAKQKGWMLWLPLLDRFVLWPQMTKPLKELK